MKLSQSWKDDLATNSRIIAWHMDILLNADLVTSQHNLKGLYDLVETHVRSLKSLGVSSDSYGNLLSSVLLSMLPQELRLIISRKTSEDDWILNTRMEELEQELKARERAAANPVNLLSLVKKHTRDQPTAGALVSVASKLSCCYCQQCHPSTTCEIVVQIDMWKQILKR